LQVDPGPPAIAAVSKEAHVLLFDRDGQLPSITRLPPMPAGDVFGDMMNAPKKYVVSKTLEKPIWRNTTIIRDDVVEAVRTLKAGPGKNILTDGSSQLVRTLLAHDLVDELHVLLYPLTLGEGKRIWDDGTHAGFTLRSATPYPTGVVALDYVRER
jgi:dihydrofolate reductase